jgi:putative intracellular protease/amidase
VLSYANIADVTVVAERAEPVRLHPFGRGPELLRVEPQSTTRNFDQHHPDGADYIVVPALEPRNNQHVLDWIVAQHRKGAKIFSVCAGSLTLAAAGLLDGRPATTHWALHRRPKEGASRHAVGARPTLCGGRWYQHIDWHHRIEPGDGRSKAEQLARDLGVANWDATGCRSGATKPLEFP